jgi:putative polyhydroxyalkanoate system protein
MAQLQIHRAHQLGWAGARRLAKDWRVQAEQAYGLQCTQESGEAQERIAFARPGLSGHLLVSAESFVLEASLGFLLSAYRDRIESELQQRLDQQLGPR